LARIQNRPGFSDRLVLDVYKRLRDMANKQAAEDEKSLNADDLAQAYLTGGNKSKAIEVFRSIKGADGVGDLARLWAIQASHS
jgi:hypothetical protein